MKLSTDRILTTHVGSLPRPDDLFELMLDKMDGKPVDEKAYAERVRKAVSDAHFFKFPAAVFEEIERVDAFWVPRLLATELLVNPSPTGHEDWPQLDRALALAAELKL